MVPGNRTINEIQINVYQSHPANFNRRWSIRICGRVVIERRLMVVVVNGRRHSHTGWYGTPSSGQFINRRQSQCRVRRWRTVVVVRTDRRETALVLDGDRVLPFGFLFDEVGSRCHRRRFAMIRTATRHVQALHAVTKGRRGIATTAELLNEKIAVTTIISTAHTRKKYNTSPGHLAKGWAPLNCWNTRVVSKVVRAATPSSHATKSPNLKKFTVKLFGNYFPDDPRPKSPHRSSLTVRSTASAILVYITPSTSFPLCVPNPRTSLVTRPKHVHEFRGGTSAFFIFPRRLVPVIWTRYWRRKKTSGDHSTPVHVHSHRFLSSFSIFLTILLIRYVIRVEYFLLKRRERNRIGHATPSHQLCNSAPLLTEEELPFFSNKVL